MDGYKMRLERGIRHSADAKSAEGQAERDVEAVRSWVNDEENWQRIKDLQIDKKQMVGALKEWRKKFWGEGAAGNEASLESIATHTLREDSHGRFLARVAGRDVVLTTGDVHSASEWGIWWRFDDSIARETQTDIMTHQVRDALAQAYDTQLMTFGTTDKLSDDRKRDTYARKLTQETSLERLPNGILAEKLLLSFLTKEMYDGDLPFQVESVDVYEDIEHKIDFVITYKGKSRGVKVEEPEHRIGIQFTLDPHAKDRKLKQISHMKKSIHDTTVEDIVLVTMPIEHVRDVFDTWRYGSDGSRTPVKDLDPRGPDRLWPADIKIAIVDHLVHGVGIR